MQNSKTYLKKLENPVNDFFFYKPVNDLDCVVSNELYEKILNFECYLVFVVLMFYMKKYVFSYVYRICFFDNWGGSACGRI